METMSVQEIDRRVREAEEAISKSKSPFLIKDKRKFIERMEKEKRRIIRCRNGY